MRFPLDSSNIFLKLEKVQLVDRSNPKIKKNGCLNLTSSHLVFEDLDSKNEIWIYYSLISSIEKLPLNISGSPILIKCKHFLTCLFIVSKERDCQSLNLTLNQFSKPSKLENLLCFKQNDHLSFLAELESVNNKKIFELESEFTRMGVPNGVWSAVDNNSSYQLCDTYPSVLYVPTSATSQVINSSASFRSRGRLPVLSYLHTNGASICRCSQPLSGFNARCVEDEQLLQLILETNTNSKIMYIVDTRPKINAMANKAQGKGYENENNYTNIQFYFLGIENIHIMRSSLQKLVECSEYNSSQSNDSFFNALEKSEWLKHIKAIIDTSIFIMEAINDQNTNVVVHCSDGWDRTSQTCALASILLDPYYRSIHGFQVLIEKEWLMFGHKFSQRCGHIFEGDSSTKEISPIFHQFLECIWQLMQQFPCAFEFNENFLIKLHEHVYSCQFGNFIGNNSKERNALNIKETTFSIWDYFRSRINNYINPLYKPNSLVSRQVIRPDTRAFNLKYWRGLYNRFDSQLNENEKIADALCNLNSNTSIYNEYSKVLEKKIAQLKLILNNPKQNEQDPTNINNSDLDEKTNVKLELDDMSKELSKITSDNSETSLKKLQQDDFKSNQVIKLDNIESGVKNLEKWHSSRNNCSCLHVYDFTISKFNCVSCGQIFCENCVDNGTVSKNLVSVCVNCLKN